MSSQILTKPCERLHRGLNDSFYRELVWAAAFTDPKEPAEVSETTKIKCIFEQNHCFRQDFEEKKCVLNDLPPLVASRSTRKALAVSSGRGTKRCLFRVA